MTQEYHVEGPVMIMLTTTAIDLDEELLNRCIVLTVDESREQTRRIHELQREARTLDGLRRKLDKAAILAAHRNAQRLLRPLRVVNPLRPQLTFLDDRTRTRRDHEKYLTLIDTIAFLHQYQRPRSNATGRRSMYIEVTLDDIADRQPHRRAKSWAARLDDLPPQTRRLLWLIDEFVGRECQRLKLARADFRFTRRDVRAAYRLGQHQLKLHLARLAGNGIPAGPSRRRGQSFVYELLYDGQGQDGKPFLIGLLDVEMLADRQAKSAPDSAHDPNEVGGMEADQSAPGRGQVGPENGAGPEYRKARLHPITTGLPSRSSRPSRKNTRPGRGKTAPVVVILSLLFSCS